MDENNKMDDIARLKEAILKEYPRLHKNDSFKFRCHSGVPCFNECCGDVNIFLTPYDIMRLKNNLGITSQEFLAKYTISPFDKNLKYPVLLLKMNDDVRKSCPFVGDKGCGVYPDRPWACRMYPLGLATSRESSQTIDSEFFFLLQEATCKGFCEEHEQTIEQWLADQGIEEYNMAGEDFKDITLHPRLQNVKGGLSLQQVEMFHTACYNLDKFRRFIFESSFLDKFEVAPDTLEKLKNDDEALLKFGYKWVRFSLFGEQTLKVKDDVFRAKRLELEKKLAAKEKRETN